MVLREDKVSGGLGGGQGLGKTGSSPADDRVGEGMRGTGGDGDIRGWKPIALVTETLGPRPSNLGPTGWDSLNSVWLV